MSQSGSRFLIPWMSALWFLGCQDLGVEVPEPGEWAIYRLSDTTLTTDLVLNEPLQSLHLAPRPFASSKDLLAYEWETHRIEFCPEIDCLLDTLALRGGSTRGRPFVVCVGEERIYLGTFWWAYSSSSPRCPFMETIGPKPRQISLPPLHQGPDPRADVRIYASLKKAGVLHEATHGTSVPLARELVGDVFGDHNGTASTDELRALDEYFELNVEAWCISSYGGISSTAVEVSSEEARRCFSSLATRPYPSEQALRQAYAGINIRTPWVSIVVLRADGQVWLMSFFRSPGPRVGSTWWQPLAIIP
jgi:hypothetical protein